MSKWFPIFTAPDGPPENVYVVATSPFSINISWSEPAIITGPTFYLIDVESVRLVLPSAKGNGKHGNKQTRKSNKTKTHRYRQQFGS